MPGVDILSNSVLEKKEKESDSDDSLSDDLCALDQSSFSSDDMHNA